MVPGKMLRAINWLVPLHLLIAAMGARIFMGWFIDHRFWVVYASLAYWLSFTLMQELLQSPVGNGYLAHALLPYWLYIVCSERRRSWVTNVLLQATIGSYLLLGGMMQYALYALFIVLFVGVMDAAVWQRTWRAVAKRGAIILTAIAITVAVAGVRFVPLAMTMLQTEQGAGLSLSDALAENVSPMAYMLRIFAPFWFGWSEDLCIGRMWGERFGVFAGVLTAALAIAGLGTDLLHRRRLPWVVLALLLVAISLDTPVAVLGHFLSGGLSVPFRRLSLFLILPLAVLAGLAGEQLDSAVHGKAMRRRVGFILIAAALLLAMVWIGFTPEDCVLIRSATQTSMVWLVAAVLIWWLAVYNLWGRKLQRPLLLGFLIMELVLAAYLLVIHTTETGRIFAPPLTVEENPLPAIAPSEGRIFTRHLDWWGNAPVFAGRYNSGGYDNISPVVIAELYSGGETVDREKRRFTEPSSLRTRQLTATRMWHVGKDGWQEVPGAQPRVRLVYAWDVVGSRAAALQMVLEESYPFAERVVMEKFPGHLVPSSSVSDANAVATIIGETPNTVTVRVATAKTGMLVLADTYYDGWEALVDGERSTIYRVNGAFRGVLVTAGEHTVRFLYRQPGLKVGLLLSAVGLGAIFALIGFVLWQKCRSVKILDGVRCS